MKGHTYVVFTAGALTLTFYHSISRFILLNRQYVDVHHA